MYAVALAAAEAASNDPGWPSWLTTTGVIGVLAFVLFLWLSGRLVRPQDVQRQLAELEQAHQSAVASVQLVASAESAAKDREIALLRERLAALVTDRDEWRAALKEQSDAREFAEKTAEKALDSAKMGAALLDTVRALIEQGGR